MSKIFAPNGHSSATLDELRDFTNQVSRFLIHNPHKQTKDTIVKSLREMLIAHSGNNAFADLTDVTLVKWMRTAQAALVDDKASPSQHWHIEGGDKKPTADKRIFGHSLSLNFPAIFKSDSRLDHTGLETDSVPFEIYNRIVDQWTARHGVTVMWAAHIMQQAPSRLSDAMKRSGLNFHSVDQNNKAIRGWKFVEPVKTETSTPAKPDVIPEVHNASIMLRLAGLEGTLEGIAINQQTTADLDADFQASVLDRLERIEAKLAERD